jgi:rhodanese-related sulfurtransferase
MAPYTFSHTSGNLLTVAIGFLFGFVLERAGFGNARNLAAQFYLHDMRVLKVMFTGIVTAMLLIFLASALGLIDFARVWVPPTYFWPGVLGGFLLGVGFIIGGYCPGTSLVALATFKLDAIFCAAGVLFGLFVFGETVPSFGSFFHHAGAVGRLTLFDWLSLDAGVVVLGVVLMAAGAFAFAEIMERTFARPGQEPQPLTSRAKRLRRGAVVAALTLAAATLWIGQPGTDRKIAWASQGLDESIRQRKIHIDPAELLGLMHDRQVSFVLVDVRRQSDYQVFHLLDARNIRVDQLDSGWASRLPSEAVVVLMSNDEQAANEAWKRLAVELNPNPDKPVSDRSRVYVLAGGVNRWLDLYQKGQARVPDPETPPAGDDTCRHAFALALGSQYPAARPETAIAPKRPFLAKVRAVKPARHAGGGCG